MRKYKKEADSIKYLEPAIWTRLELEHIVALILFCYNKLINNEAIDGMILTSNQETTQEKIINLIKKNPAITQAEMAEILDLTRDGISYNIKILKEKGIIDRVGSTKNGIWKIL